MKLNHWSGLKSFKLSNFIYYDDYISSVINEVGASLPPWPCLQKCVLSIKCTSVLLFM